MWTFEEVLIEVESDKTVLGLTSTKGYLNSLLIPRKLAIDLRDASVTGCILSHVGGREPADWYVMNSDHILTAAAFPRGSREQLLNRTSMCREDHASEPIPSAGMGTSNTVAAASMRRTSIVRTRCLVGRAARRAMACHFAKGVQAADRTEQGHSVDVPACCFCRLTRTRTPACVAEEN